MEANIENRLFFSGNYKMNIQKHTLSSLENDLTALGINKDDTLLIRADLGKVGRVEGKPGETILQSMLNAVGEKGTIASLSFTMSFNLANIDNDYIFNKNTPPISGALPKIMLNHTKAVRSKHPSNSFVAIGKNADMLLKGHDEKSAPFYPIKNLIDLHGKMLLIGCAKNSPGFTTVHKVQEDLGLSSRSIVRNKRGIYFEKNGHIKLFRQEKIGGCSLGFYKFYSYYIMKEKLKTGFFGNAYSVIINAKDAYDIEYEILSREPTFALCDNPDCYICRAGWMYNKKDIPWYYIRKILKRIKIIIF